jgi:hypothetical protein
VVEAKDVSAKATVVEAKGANDKATAVATVATQDVHDKATVEARDVPATALEMDAETMNADGRLTNGGVTTNRKSMAMCASSFSRAHGRLARKPMRDENAPRLGLAGKVAASRVEEAVIIAASGRVGEIVHRGPRHKAAHREDPAGARDSEDRAPRMPRIAARAEVSDRAATARSGMKGHAVASDNDQADHDVDRREALLPRAAVGPDGPNGATRISQGHSSARPPSGTVPPGGTLRS